MSVFKDDEKRVADNLKKMDFGRLYSAHKDELWKELNARNKLRTLLDDELDWITVDVNPEE